MVLPLLALTWMSAVLAMTDRRSVLFQALFAVFNSAQGFVITAVHCFLRREVARLFLFAPNAGLRLLPTVWYRVTRVLQALGEGTYSSGNPEGLGLLQLLFPDIPAYPCLSYP